MSAHKHIDRICAAAALLCVLLTVLFMNGEALGVQLASRAQGYETRLFDTSRVHTIDIVMDDWDSFIETCENEEYAACAVVIDGEAYKNAALRAKGNTSLSAVSQLGSDRYSFKIEFDHYDSGMTYYGLDKLSLNNVIQDNTYMKDYLTYQMMAAFGANAPLCSFVYITVNGGDWGLYLAVEGLEDGFLQRNYGNDHGELYKPDSLSFGGGRGNGMDFRMDDLMGGDGQDQQQNDAVGMGSPGSGHAPGGSFAPENAGGSEEMPEGGSAPFSKSGGGFDPGGMGSSDVKLQYIDDDPDSYSNIFSNAKTDVTEADQVRLIQALKALSEGGDMSEVLDIDQVLRYFVVHNFVVNGDSYTGSMVHNYYLYEEGGKLAMLPWDYNLAYGTFQGGSASGAVNDPIDSPLSVTGSGDRPMADWIFSNEEYTALYHQYFSEFLSTVDPDRIIEEAYALIASYVEQDPTKFCTVEEFELGVAALKSFCALRMESVSGQLDGTIPSTSAGQSEDRDALVDASALDLSDMGTMNNGGGPGGEGGPGEAGGAFDGNGDGQPAFGAAPVSGDEEGGMPDRQPSGGMQRPESLETGNSSGFNGPGPAGDAPQTGNGILLLAVSAAVLLAGLAIAFKFKR